MMMMIDGGQFMHDVLTEDQVQGEAFAELKRIFLAWDRPAPPWPEGTTFTEARKARHWSSQTSWAITPAGVRYELMVEHLREGEPDPREVPPVLWSILVDRYGAIYAHPRIAQMHVTLDPPHPVDEERKLDAYAGVPLGLKRTYRVGQLSRPLHEETHTVSDGWRYRGSPT